jgi:protoporphyrinogen oxidase
MKKYDVIIVGAGISGLSFAHYAAQANLKILVLEKSLRPGGSFHTANLTKGNGNFWIELGAHTCYNSYQNLIGIMEDCGIANEIYARAKAPFRVLAGDRIRSFTSQINFLELLASMPRAFGKTKAGETVESYYGSILGRRNFRRIFSALFSAVPSQKADEFPADALFKKRERRKDILKHYTMKNGLGSITDAITKEKGIEVKYGMDIRSVNKDAEGIYSIATKDGDFESANLAICTAVAGVGDLISSVAPEISEKAARIKYQPIESFGVVIAREDTDLQHFAGLVPTNDDFFSAVSRDTVPDNKFRGFTFHFKPGILTKEQKIEKVSSILRVKSNQLIEIQEKMNIVPSLRLGHYELVNEIDALLKGKNLYLSGNYFAGLSIEDCVGRSKQEVARMLSK